MTENLATFIQSKGLDDLRKLHGCHSVVGQGILASCKGNLSPMDIFSMTTLDRSLHNIEAFICLLEKANYQCSVIILRAQLDTLLRYFAHTQMSDPQEFSVAVLKGKQINRMHDRNSKKLTDAELKKRLGDKYNWVSVVYDFCCGYAHFSQVHFFEHASKCGEIEADGLRNITIGAKDNVSDDEHKKLVAAFGNVSGLLLQHVTAWITSGAGVSAGVTH
jgi:hypothetical protein